MSDPYYRVTGTLTLEVPVEFSIKNLGDSLEEAVEEVAWMLTGENVPDLKRMVGEWLVHDDLNAERE